MTTWQDLKDAVPEQDNREHAWFFLQNGGRLDPGKSISRQMAACRAIPDGGDVFWYDSRAGRPVKVAANLNNNDIGNNTRVRIDNRKLGHFGPLGSDREVDAVQHDVYSTCR